MARYEEALDAQLEFVSKASSNEFWRRGMRLWLEAERKKNRMTTDDRGVELMPDRLAIMAYNADPIYVDPDMMTLWEATFPSFEPEPLMAEDLITPAGFLWLPRPYYCKDLHGRTISTRAILWHPQGFVYKAPDEEFEQAPPGTPIAGVRLEMAQGDLLVPSERKPDNSFETQGILFTALHYTDDTDDYTIPGYMPSTLIVHQQFPWSYRSKFTHTGIEDRPLADRIEVWQALWRLMQQTIATREIERADRPTRRRMERAHWPERRITVIRLRRPHHEPDESHEPRDVHWTRRWIVEAYWRAQWYGSGENRYQRQVLVSGHVKGPEDMPLVVRKGRVFELVR